MKISIKFFFFLIITGISFTGCKEKSEKENAKYVFFFIGDGMGLSQRALTEMYLASLHQEIGQQRLLVDSFPIQGLATTYSLNSYITCSAASGTALATGKKTKNGMISTSPDSLPYRTIAEAARAMGRSVGIITNVTLNHATPAAFSAHEPSRKNLKQIREDQLITGFDFFAGGYVAIEDSVTTADKKLFYQQATKAGYVIIDTQNGLQKINSENKYIVFSDATEKSGEMFFAIDQPERGMTLLQMFQNGLNVLSKNQKGFFMMLESGKIDWAAHHNDAATMIKETIAFNEITRAAFDFYKKHPKETLIVVTADHETGGLALGNAEMRYVMKPELLQYQKASVDKIQKIYLESRMNVLHSNLQNNKKYPFQFIQTWFGLGLPHIPLNKFDSIAIMSAWEKDMSPQNNDEQLIITAKNILEKKSGIGWTTSQHSGTPVPVSAIGVGAEKFSGYYDNTEIPKKIAQLMDGIKDF